MTLALIFMALFPFYVSSLLFRAFERTRGFGLGTKIDPRPALNGPVDIHPALQDVRQLKEFQPPEPGLLDELLKLPIFRQLGQQLELWLKQFINELGRLFSKLAPLGMQHLPENIRSTFNGLIGFILVLMALYALYIILGWLRSLQENRFRKIANQSRIFEELSLINSAHHYQQALEYSKAGQYAEAVRQLYVATLCLLDEAKIVPYQTARSNGEYIDTLSRYSLTGLMVEKARTLSLKENFEHLSRCFESFRYGGYPVSEPQFVSSQAAYQAFELVTVEVKAQQHD